LLHYASTDGSCAATTALILKVCIPNLEAKNKVDPILGLVLLYIVLICVSDQLGRTPLHISSLFDNQEAAKLLVAYGADIDSIDAVSSVALLCGVI
jgi:ankyrin repeat protein